MSEQEKPIKVEKELHSSMKLLFGRCGAWQMVNGKPCEKESIFECNTPGRRNNFYTGDRFAQSQFWRSTSARFWQYDDFTFDGIAAASYLIDAHRFKIWFNPTKFYDYVYQCAVYIDENEKVSKKKSKNNKSEDPDIDEREQEWCDVISGKNTKFDVKLSKLGWDRRLAQALRECEKNKTWNFNAWIMWSDALISTPYIAQNCESVFVHEMFHIIWNHLARTEERDSAQFNIASDYAINQTLNFTVEFASGLVTRNNTNFFNRFIVSTVKYLMQTEIEVSKSLKADFKIDEKTDFDKIITNEKLLKELYESYMMNPSQHGWDKVDKFANKSADLYYRILLESCIIVSGDGIGGYDKHEKWGDTKGNGNEGKGDEDGDGKGKGAADGTETCKKAGDDAQPDYHSEHNKMRGKGGREEHKGFDAMEAAASRSEVKATVRDSLERCGVNIDDPSEIEKALKATPGMDILGALIMDWFKVRRKNWRTILKKELTSFSNPQDIDYTMSRESRVPEGFFPGKKRERGLDVIFQVDTSGSINLKDWNDFVNQIEEIARSCDVKMMRCLQVHSVIACDEMVNLRRVKNWRIKETGGTTMALGPEKLKREGNKKLLIIFTDGYTDVFFQKDFPFKIIIFLSRGNSHNTETFKERGFTVINQDEE
jgi:predicted metal-dependent peptidase